MAKLSIFVRVQARDWVPCACLQCWGLRGSSRNTSELWPWAPCLPSAHLHIFESHIQGEQSEDVSFLHPPVKQKCPALNFLVMGTQFLPPCLSDWGKVNISIFNLLSEILMITPVSAFLLVKGKELYTPEKLAGNLKIKES